MTELKPCPFCGGKATAFRDNYNRIGILCENCNLYFGIELECGEELVDGWRAKIKTVGEAVEAWNRRAEMAEYIKRESAINALWKALHKYQDDTEKLFLESAELSAEDWFTHRIFVQNMSDIDRKVISEIPLADVQPVRRGKWEDCSNGSMCSCCYRDVTKETPFCPNCGADMREITKG